MDRTFSTIADMERVLGTANTPDDLAVVLCAMQAEVRATALQRPAGLALARHYSDCVDAVIRRMFELAAASAGFTGPSDSVPVSIVGTGGYGRQELCPHSDLDITFVPIRDGDASIDRVVKEMFTVLMKVLMDAAQMEVGYAYRLLEDCGHLDHQTASGLLDARLIAGNRRVFIQFESEFWSNFNSAEFVFAKLDERRRRHAQAGNTPRVVEPDLKAGPGGLRDIQTAIWLIQAREALSGADVRGDRAWRALAKHGGLSDRQIADLRSAKEFLLRVRNVLHATAGREVDQLSVTRQEEVAGILGYHDRDHLHPGVEVFMRELYKHLADADRIGQEVAESVENGRLVMGIGLDCVRRELTPANPLLVREDPIWMAWASHLAQLYDLGFSAELRNAVLSLLGDNPTTSEPERLAEVFTNILACRRPVYPVLQLMADLGILGWILPEVGGTLDLIPYEPVHDYTVGQHTLYVVRNLDALREPGVPDDLRELQVLMAELAAPEQLYLAALLHDVGKADPSAPHWETGAAVAAEVCTRLRWREDAKANVTFLVRHHLLMAETSRLRDLGLPETIRNFTQVVKDPELLRMLYLLTYADTRAVSEGQWTQVKARFLQELYKRAEHALAAGFETGDDDLRMTRTRRRLIRELAVENLPAEEVAAHLEGMPAHYVLNTSLEEIALHIGFARQARAGVPLVSFHDDRLATFTEVTICTLDDPKPGLLAKIAGVLYAADLTVHAAQVFTRVDGPERIALDTLCVDFRGRRLASAKRAEVERNLRAVLTGQATVESILAKRSRGSEQAPTVEQIRVLNDVSERFTIVEMGFSSPHGVLYYAAKALSELGWDIQSARLSRFRGHSMATFYVTGAKELDDAQAARMLEQQLAHTKPPSQAG